MHIDLLVDLGSPHEHEPVQPRLPLLERCLARGDHLPLRADRFDACLLRDFGLDPDDAPIAALSLAGDGEAPGSHYWLRADPVHLQPTLHRIAGRALAPGELDWAEARARAAVLAPHLAADGCELRVKDPLRWYLRCPPQQLRTTAPPRTQAALDEALMPAGPDGPRWQRVMTEAQMLLHGAELDAARERTGRVPVNGIWIWGGGVAGVLDATPYTDVISDDVLALGLARQSNAVATALPDDPRALVAGWHHDPNRRVLLAVSGARHLSPAVFETAWLTPLMALLSEQRAEQLDLRLLLGDRRLGRRITRKAMRRWWRRIRPLAAHA